MKSRNKIWTILSILLLIVVSCAPQPEKRRKINLVWPLPPDKPRIKFVRLIRSTLDVGKEASLSASLFGEEGATSFSKPYGVAVDKDGKIYVTDIGKVFVFDLKNKEHFFIGDTPGVGQLKVPIGIDVSDDGYVFVSDPPQKRVFVYYDGRFYTAIGKKEEFEKPSGVAVDNKLHRVYIVDTDKHHVVVYSTENYKKIMTIGKRGYGDGEFNYPTNIAVDSESNIYVVDTLGFRVEVFSPDGKFIRAFGEACDAPGCFARPKGIGIDSKGHIYVADAAFQNYQIFNKEGKVLLFVGESGVGPGKFILPAGLYVDKRTDMIYVVNQLPGYLQIFKYIGGDDMVAPEEETTESAKENKAEKAEKTQNGQVPEKDTKSP